MVLHNRGRRLAVPAALLAAACLAACGASTTGPADPAASASPTAAASPSGSANPSASAAPSALEGALVRRIDEYAKGTQKNGITGVIVGVRDPQKGYLLKAYGTSDKAGTIPMTTDMHYRIASVTKTFTAYAILRLVDEGKLSLGDPVSKYVPDIPNGDRITVRDLLAMRSGLYDYINDAALTAAYDKDPLLPGYTVDRALQILRAHAAQCTAPNQKTAYTNTNYVLLGFILEKVTGQTAAAHLDGLVKDLGLTQTRFATTPDLPQPFSRGYTLSSDPHPERDVTRSNVDFPWTAGAMVSTVPDMLDYAQQLGTGKNLTASTFAQRQGWHPLSPSGVRVQYGLGLLQIGDWIGHDGSIDGYSDVVAYLPAAKTSVVVMVNAADGEEVPSTDLFGDIAKLLYPDSLPSY